MQSGSRPARSRRQQITRIKVVWFAYVLLLKCLTQHNGETLQELPYGKITPVEEPFVRGERLGIIGFQLAHDRQPGALRGMLTRRLRHLGAKRGIVAEQPYSFGEGG